VNADRDWRIPRLEVEATIEDTFDRYQVGRMLCDPPKWQTEIERWMERYGDETVLFFDTNQARRMAFACDRFSTALGEGSLSHPDDPVLTGHTLAMARKKVKVSAEDDDGRTRYVFTKGEDTRKIDAGIAAVLALEAAMTMPDAPVASEPWAAFA
jgi:phage terminase large subunit-like protein